MNAKLYLPIALCALLGYINVSAQSSQLYATTLGDTIRIIHDHDTITLPLHSIEMAAWPTSFSQAILYLDTLQPEDQPPHPTPTTTLPDSTSTPIPDSAKAKRSTTYHFTTLIDTDTLQTSDIEMVHIDGNTGNLKIIRRDGKGFKITDGHKQYRVSAKRGKRYMHWMDDNAKTQKKPKSHHSIDEAFDLIEESLDNIYQRKRTSFRGHWAGIEWGFTWLLDHQWGIRFSGESAPYKLKNGRSYTFALNPFQYSIELGTPHFGLVTGIGFNFRRYEFPNHGILLQLPNPSETEEAILNGTLPISSSRLRTYHFTVPILFELQNRSTRLWKRHYLALGAIGDVLMGANYQVVTNNGRHLKYSHGFGIANLQVAPTLRVGTGPVRLFINVYPLGLLEHNKGPRLIPFEIGFALLHF